MASTCLQEVSYPIPTVVWRISATRTRRYVGRAHAASNPDILSGISDHNIYRCRSAYRLQVAQIIEIVRVVTDGEERRPDNFDVSGGGW